MPEYVAPGVYVEEIERGPKPIEGVATSTAAFLGEAERGPVMPRLITHYNDYLLRFGNVFGADKYLPYSLKSFFDNGGQRCYVARIVGNDATTAETAIDGYKIRAVGPGVFGNRIFVKLGPGTNNNDGSPGFDLQVYYWDRLPDGQTPFDPTADGAPDLPPTLSEEFDQLSLSAADPDYYDKRVNHGNSSLVEIEVHNAERPSNSLGQALTNGKDGDAVSVANYTGEAHDADERTGLAALDLDPYRDVVIVYAPAANTDVVRKVIAHCENNRYRFAVVDSEPGLTNVATLEPRNDYDTKYAAFYYPWIVINDPLTGQRTTIPPGGAVCGIYARSDRQHGVWKAPANETVVGAVDLAFDVDRVSQELLNPRGVNAIRRFPGRGIRVWGARTLGSDPLWKYVNVARLLIFLEKSIVRGTQWVVFEPNDHRLWARVKQTIANFLGTQWRAGALLGAKEEHAYFVSVGRDTMTEDDILNGRLIVEIGIAPVRPAEFVIFRVFQKTLDAQN